jgi:predicted GNAT family N-acyltransferase
MVLKITPFDSRSHDRSNFNCGKDSLNHYIQKQASQDLKKRVTTVFVLIDEPAIDVLAYYTLSSYTVEIEDLEEDFVRKLPRYPHLPATLLGRLAVDASQKGRGFGELMLVNALQKSLEASTQIASVAVVVEALDADALSFYIKYGFQKFRNESMKLYLPMKAVEQMSSNNAK